MVDKLKKVFVGEAIFYGRRKYSLVLLSMSFITFGLLLATLLPAASPLYSTYVTAIIGLNAVYGGANVGNKLVKGKTQNDEPDS